MEKQLNRHLISDLSEIVMQYAGNDLDVVMNQLTTSLIELKEMVAEVELEENAVAFMSASSILSAISGGKTYCILTPMEEITFIRYDKF